MTQIPKKLTNCVKLKAATRNFYFLLILAFVLITMKYKCNIFSILFFHIAVYRIELIIKYMYLWLCKIDCCNMRMMMQRKSCIDIDYT